VQVLDGDRIDRDDLRQQARTAANVSGSTISLTAASATITMMLATTNPTKLHAHTPNLGTSREVPGRDSNPWRCPLSGLGEHSWRIRQPHHRYRACDSTSYVFADRRPRIRFP
jgi:hypothetical protein